MVPEENREPNSSDPEEGKEAVPRLILCFKSNGPVLVLPSMEIKSSLNSTAGLEANSAILDSIAA